jgi:hypothetical protein
VTERFPEPVRLTLGAYTVLVSTEPPSLLDAYVRHAETVDDLRDGGRQSSGYVLIGISEDRAEAEPSGWPQLVVIQRFAPSGAGFGPGILVTPVTRQLFVGAGTWLAGYDRRAGRWERSFADECDTGFFSWRQHGDVVLMSAELELAAWTTTGRKLWSTFVEPPWSYRVADDQVNLDVMGSLTHFDLTRGPHRSS